MIAFLGKHLQRRHPHIISAAEFARDRFGPLAQLLVVLLLIFNMSIAMLAEFVTMGIIFKDFVGTNSYGVILFYSVLTTIYCALGGLFISIITDVFQGVTALVLAIIASIYVAVEFRPTLPSLTDDLVWGVRAPTDDQARYGFSSLLSLPASLFAATIFSEAMWQRCWASASEKSLRRGSILGCILTVLLTFLAAFAGWIAAWSGRYAVNANLQLFEAFPDQTDSGSPYVASWISVVTIICAGVMSQGAVDSLQNGLTCTITSYFLPHRPVRYARMVVVLINAVLLVVAVLSDAKVLQLFLVANVLACCVALPFLSGLLHCTRVHRFISGDTMVLASLTAILATSAFGIILRWNDWPPGSNRFYEGLRWSWYTNGYDWKVFLVALGSSVVAIILIGLVGLLVRRHVYQGPGLNDAFAKMVGKISRAVESKWPSKPSSSSGESEEASKNMMTVDSDGKVSSGGTAQTPAVELSPAGFDIQNPPPPAKTASGRISVFSSLDARS